MIRINNVLLLSPSTLSVQSTLQGGSARYNALGKMLLDGRREKRRVEIGWARLSASELAALSGALTEGFVTLSYPDPLAGQRQMECLVTEKEAQVWRMEQSAAYWAQVKLRFDER